MDVNMGPLAVQLLVVFLGGTVLGSFVNWAIYSLAWYPRPISPWSSTPDRAAPRGWGDRVPVLGWWKLSRESPIHGSWFWLRPMLLEIALGAALAALYWWEVDRLGLIRDQLPHVARIAPMWPIYLQFTGHALLLCWMLAASFIDLDEKIIPDEITVTGTLLGLLLATVAPLSLLPQVTSPGNAPVVGVQLIAPGGGPLVGPNGTLWLEPVTAVAPDAWPPPWGAPRRLTSLFIGLACYWLWCFALAPRIWRGRRGPLVALQLIASRVRRELCRPPLRNLLIAGTAAVPTVWAYGGAPWAGLLTALIGLIGSGGIVWAVRIVGSLSLRKEAMGFGDVLLMMMVGTFLGWQACLIAFFIAPLPGLLVGIAQFLARRDDVIPYGPYLCLGSAAVVVRWGPIWMWGQPLFQAGALVPIVVGACLLLLGLLLGIWHAIKTWLFGDLP